MASVPEPQRSPKLEALFVDLGVADVAVFLCRDLLANVHLSIAETAFIENAVEGRRHEFATGRACARAALGALGVAAPSIPVGEGRQPQWPGGVTAAITHTRRNGRQFVAAAAALSPDRGFGIGIDAEVIQPLKDGVREMLLVESEITAVDELPETERTRAAIAVFSAKEAFYKAQYALTSGWVGFGDMYLDSFDGSGCLHQTGDLAVLADVETPARFAQTEDDGLLVSAVVARRTAPRGQTLAGAQVRPQD